MRAAPWLAALTLLLSGCSAGALGEDGTAATSTTCTAQQPGTTAVDGNLTLENTGRSTIEVREVALVRPRGTVLREAHLAPLVDDIRLGTTSFPPRGKVWEGRVPLPTGLSVRAGEVNLLLVVDLAAGAVEAGFDDVVVTYLEDGEERTRRMGHRAVFVDPETCPG